MIAFFVIMKIFFPYIAILSIKNNSIELWWCWCNKEKKVFLYLDNNNNTKWNQFVPEGNTKFVFLIYYLMDANMNMQFTHQWNHSMVVGQCICIYAMYSVYVTVG